MQLQGVRASLETLTFENPLNGVCGELECIENMSVLSGESMEWGIEWNGGVYRMWEFTEWGSVWSGGVYGVGSIWSVGM